MKKVKATAKKEPAPLPKALLPQGKMPRFPTFHETPFRWLIRWHWAYKRKAIRGMHKCPSCGTIGTYKPYGGWWKDRDCKRWLCKWCGFYDGVDQRCWCVVDESQGCWVEASQNPANPRTPESIMREAGLNPWAG